MNLKEAKRVRRKHRILAKANRYYARRDKIAQVAQVPKTFTFPQAKLGWWEKTKLYFYEKLHKA